MPMPPILDVVNWQEIFASGQDFDAWLAGAQNPDKKQKMQELLAEQRLDPQVEAHLKGLPRTVHVVAIAEDWCGDVVRHVPVLQRMAQATDRLHVRFIPRAQHRDVFVRFLTNGGEAIPKFVFLSESFVECGSWGPMQANCRKLIARGKASGDGKTARERVSALYDADPERRVVVEELMELVDIASALSP